MDKKDLTSKSEGRQAFILDDIEYEANKIEALGSFIHITDENDFEPDVASWPETVDRCAIAIIKKAKKIQELVEIGTGRQTATNRRQSAENRVHRLTEAEIVSSEG